MRFASIAFAFKIQILIGMEPSTIAASAMTAAPLGVLAAVSYGMSKRIAPRYGQVVLVVGAGVYGVLLGAGYVAHEAYQAYHFLGKLRG